MINLQPASTQPAPLLLLLSTAVSLPITGSTGLDLFLARVWRSSRTGKHALRTMKLLQTQVNLLAESSRRLSTKHMAPWAKMPITQR
jgi:hypothetical protein